MAIFKKIAFSVLCVLLGAVFIFSAYTKLYPIEPFEYTFVDLGISNWYLSPFIARLLIAFEFLIGVLLILNIALKRFTYKLGIITLLVFCVYLILQLIISGNKGNCGCFGTTIYMSPAKALLKNILMLALFVVLYIFHIGFGYGRFSKLIVIIISLVSIALPFILNPVELDYSKAYLNKPENNYKIELDTLYNNAYLNTPPKELSKGKHIISFMSLTCPHCRIAAKKIHILNEKNPAIPFYFVLNGENDKLQTFFDDTHTENIPHCMLKGHSFVYLGGVSLPSIFLVNNSVVENQVNYITLDQQEVEKWLAIDIH
jgi:methylamine utilization protein MauE